MVCNILSLGLYGVSGYLVEAECALSNGLPAFDVVGLPDAAVKEARERVRSAIRDSGFTFPVSRITVNLAPADRKKAGTVYDLPGVQMVPLARLQVFPREEFDQPDRYLKAGDRILPCGEAGDRVVFSDDRYVVLDMTDLAGDPPLDQLLEEAESPRSGDLGYLRIACDYCREHLGQHISAIG